MVVERLSSSLEQRLVKRRVTTMSTDQERRDLDERARRGETVIPGGTGGKSLEAQEHLAEGGFLVIMTLDWFII